MFSKRNDEEQSHWISFTDLVSGFMIVFIVVSLVALGQIKPEKKIPPPGPNPPSDKPDTTSNPPTGKYQEMVGIFGEMLDSLKLKDVEIADSATIRFSVKPSSPDPLFRQGDSSPTTYFRKILTKFLPAYLEKIRELYDDQKSQSFIIKEIRIEGHTDPAGDYLLNLALSSNRALEIQKYLLKYIEDRNNDKDFRRFMEKNSIACGYSFSRTLNKDGQIVDHSKTREVDFDKSRRVEFRILLEYQKPTTHEN